MNNARRTVLSNYATFSGRASRAELWWWVLFVFILMAVTQAVDAAIIAPALGFQPYESAAGQPLSLLLALVLFIPNLAVGVRRLHDINKSGWWLLIGLVPLIGGLVLLYFYLCKGDQEPNSFGSPMPAP